MGKLANRWVNSIWNSLSQKAQPAPPGVNVCRDQMSAQRVLQEERGLSSRTYGVTVAHTSRFHDGLVHATYRLPVLSSLEATIHVKAIKEHELAWVSQVALSVGVSMNACRRKMALANDPNMEKHA